VRETDHGGQDPTDMIGLTDLPLIDQHCHGVLTGPASTSRFADLLAESGLPTPAGVDRFDSQLGRAVRRRCAPLLGLGAHVPGRAYLARRDELGAADVAARMLTAAGIDTFLVDTGLRSPTPSEPLTTPDELAALVTGARAFEVTRIESVAERAAARTRGADDLPEAIEADLADAATRAVAFKSIIAYRAGLDVPAKAPDLASVRKASRDWLAQIASSRRAPRLTDPVLLHHTLWCAVRAAATAGLPLQIHTGFGDTDLTLHDSDPSLLTAFVRAVHGRGVRLVLLHCYPYHRQAGYLAYTYPHVYVDAGLAVNHVGPRAPAVLAEFLELTPVERLLFSTDAYGLPELYLTGAALFRQALGAVLGAFVADGSWLLADARRAARRIGSTNARELYRIG
jgi:predicted TIM-barrel fold metal-dependent hydrolase